MILQNSKFRAGCFDRSIEAFRSCSEGSLESKRCIVTLGSDSHVTKSYQGLQLSRCWWDQIRQSRAGIVATSYLPPIERSAYEDTQGLRGINQLLFSEVSARFIDHCYDAQMEPLCQAPLAHSGLDIHQT